MSPAKRAGGAAETPKAKPASSLREAQKELARQRLIDAARQAFETKGYVEVTVDDIVQGAGTSRGTFYLYFQSKGEVLRAIAEELRREVEAAGLFDDIREISHPTVETLQTWFEKYVAFYTGHRKLWWAMHQAQAIEPDFGTIVVDSISNYVELWKAGGRPAQARDEDLRLAATMLYTLSDQFMYLWLTQGRRLNQKKTTRALAEAFLAALPT